MNPQDQTPYYEKATAWNCPVCSVCSREKSYIEEHIKTHKDQTQAEARTLIGSIAKWLEEYHELDVKLLKFEHPAEREKFYNDNAKLIDQYANQRALKLLDELEKTKLPEDIKTDYARGWNHALDDFIEAKRLNLTKKG